MKKSHFKINKLIQFTPLICAMKIKDWSILQIFLFSICFSSWTQWTQCTHSVSFGVSFVLLDKGLFHFYFSFLVLYCKMCRNTVCTVNVIFTLFFRLSLVVVDSQVSFFAFSVPSLFSFFFLSFFSCSFSFFFCFSVVIIPSHDNIYTDREIHNIYFCVAVYVIR